MRIIGYTYEADIHCPDCAYERFKDVMPRNALDENAIPEQARDNEGNPIHPIFDTDESEYMQTCCDCGAIVSNPDSGEQWPNERRFLVRWEIDIYAKSPRAAAKEAQRIMRDKDSIATVFEVNDVASAGESETIDLTEEAAC